MTASDNKASAMAGKGSDSGTKGNHNKRFTFKQGLERVKFEGREEDLKGFVYDDQATFRQEHQWTKTTQEIARCVNTNYSKYGWDVAQAIRSLAELAEQMSPAGSTVSVVEQKKYELKLTNYLKKEIGVNKSLKNA